MTVEKNHNLWGIVLAGGEGTRVREFLVHICGGRGTKQFCAVTGRRSMLEHTLDRVERLIPRRRILVIVGEHHRAEATPQLAHWPRENVIFQPSNRDTAPGILLPLAHISHREPCATVAVFPAGHFVLDEARFIDSVQMAVSETQQCPEALTLLGMTPNGVDEGYGWIEPGERVDDCTTRSVHRFWEKPTPLQACKLLRRGALWNSFVGSATAHTLWDMTRLAAPDLYRDFSLIRRALSVHSEHAQDITAAIYRQMRAVNFSTEICQPLAGRLRVLPTPDVGWSDWGSEERICSSLRQLGKLEECLARRQHGVWSTSEATFPLS